MVRELLREQEGMSGLKVYLEINLILSYSIVIIKDMGFFLNNMFNIFKYLFLI